MSHGREGVNKSNKTHKATICGPDPKSARSKRRAKRGFRGVESTRLHKRADNRLKQAQTFKGTRHPAGTKVSLGPGSEVTAGGTLRYH